MPLLWDTDPTAEITSLADGDTALVHDVSETAVGRKMKWITWANIKAALAAIFRPDGWVPVTGTFSWASASTINISSGGASVYSVGDRLKWVTATGSTQRYGTVIAVASTLLTIAVNTDHPLVNEAWTLPYYSHASSPVGFPQVFNYTPTGPTNTTLTGRFQISGRMCYGDIHAAVTGTPSFASSPTLPVPAGANNPTYLIAIGSYLQHSVATRFSKIGGRIGANDTYAALFSLESTSGDMALVSATVPITWSNTDWWTIQFSYEI